MRKSVLLGFVCFCAAGSRAPAQTIEQLQQLSIDELANLEITSVTKNPEPLSDAQASVYVITHDQIVRSGAPNLAEILRLAPNLQVQQINASRYIVTARGLSGNLSDQNFANKLLVLVDGRSVYTPLFSGVYWDMQDVVVDDIDRIEVSSGPGATLWGANAVNGVINIITRKSSETQGGLVDVQAGNLAQVMTARYGGALGRGVSYRFYVKDYIGNDTAAPNGLSTRDHWSKPQGGFRLDWDGLPSDALSLSGDFFRGAVAQPAGPDENLSGGNLTAHWTHILAGGTAFQALAYYDSIGRGNHATGDFWQNTYDIEIQHSFPVFGWNDITWGAGYRSVAYQINGSQELSFVPAGRTLNLGNMFVQDSISVTPSVRAILGLKLENDPYSGWAALPSARFSWKAGSDTLIWVAVSRAVRSPTPFDRDVVEAVGKTILLTGNPDFQPEGLVSYEAGLRMQPATDAAFSISSFYDVYDDLKSIEPTPGGFFPLTWGNLLAARTYGVEMWGSYDVTPRWRLFASFSELAEDFRFKPGASGIAGVAQLGDDAERRASLRSTMDLGSGFNLDAELRYVSALPDPHVPAYAELNASIGWNVNSDLRLSVSGFNLLHARHQEFPIPDANEVPRSALARLQWRF